MLTTYIGRFAPSPTGPLHMGSLVTALASWVDARFHNGAWLLRIEDIDPPREVSGATDEIIAALSAHGLHWDGLVTRQSQRSALYEVALAQLRANNRLYACQCTRKQLRAIAQQLGDNAYPGTCQSLQLAELNNPLRLKVDNETTSFVDSHAGEISENVSLKTGDYIVRRRDKLYAYQLAVVVDDADQGITHVVRGADMLDNSPRQIVLQKILRYPIPSYFHLPLVLHPDGRKLSKQTGAQKLNPMEPIANLQTAWSCLGQTSVSDTSKVSEFLKQAVANWQPTSIPKIDTAMFHF